MQKKHFNSFHSGMLQALKHMHYRVSVLICRIKQVLSLQQVAHQWLDWQSTLRSIAVTSTVSQKTRGISVVRAEADMHRRTVGKFLKQYIKSSSICKQDCGYWLVDGCNSALIPAGVCGKAEDTCLTSWLGILLMREAGGVPVRRIICCSWFISTTSESRGVITQKSMAKSIGG